MFFFQDKKTKYEKSRKEKFQSNVKSRSFFKFTFIKLQWKKTQPNLKSYAVIGDKVLRLTMFPLNSCSKQIHLCFPCTLREQKLHKMKEVFRSKRSNVFLYKLHVFEEKNPPALSSKKSACWRKTRCKKQLKSISMIIHFHDSLVSNV